MKYHIVQYNKTLSIRFLLSILGVLFVFFFSYSTSPLYPDYYGGDSAQFLTIGREWMMGKSLTKNCLTTRDPLFSLLTCLVL